MNGDCVYCGMPALETDHVPPRCFRTGLAGAVEFLVVASCAECNSILGARPLFTLKARKRFVREALRKKYRRVLRMPNWHYSELDDLDGRLEQFVRNSQTSRGVIEMRIDFSKVGDTGASV